MSLLGMPLLVMLGLVALVMPGVALVAWGQVRGKRWMRAGQRVGLVLVAQATAMLFGLAALNDYGQFFTSWSELLGTAHPQVVATHHFGAGQSTHVVRARSVLATHMRATAVVEHRGAGWPSTGARPTPWAARSLWRTTGEVMAVRLPGRTTGLTEPALVYLPPSYFTGQRAMPIVEVFSGYPGSTYGLMDRLDYPAHLLSALRAGTARPMVLVMLRPSVTYPRDTECTNVPHGPQAFSYFASDVPSAVADIFGLHPTARAAIGDSTGGMCATKLAVLDPQQFTAAVSLSGYYHAITDFTTGDLYGGSTTIRHLNDIMWRLANLPQPHVSLLICTALTEPGADGYRSAQRLLALVRPPLSADEIVLNHGGHNFATWNVEIPRAMVWLSRHLA